MSILLYIYINVLLYIYITIDIHMLSVCIKLFYDPLDMNFRFPMCLKMMRTAYPLKSRYFSREHDVRPRDFWRSLFLDKHI